uniref:Uncharacterized protein n=1 Tax=Arundo donax TaxID=35708 RepID=A0A0A9BRX1_ARUDO
MPSSLLPRSPLLPTRSSGSQPGQGRRLGFHEPAVPDIPEPRSAAVLVRHTSSMRDRMGRSPALGAAGWPGSHFSPSVAALGDVDGDDFEFRGRASPSTGCPRRAYRCVARARPRPPAPPRAASMRQ